MDAPLRNPPVSQKTLADSLRSIEINLDVMAKTMNTLKKPSGKDHRLSYDEHTQTFAPVSLLSIGHSVDDVLKGLWKLNVVAKQVYDEIRSLPNTPQTQREREEFRNRFKYLCEFAINETNPCLEALKVVYGVNESQEVRGTEKSAVYMIHQRGTQTLLCLTKSKEMLDAAANGENPLLQSVILQGDEAQDDGISELVSLPKILPANIQACLDQLVGKHQKNREFFQAQDHQLDAFLEVDPELISQCLEDFRLMKQQAPSKDLLKAAIAMENNTRRFFNNLGRIATVNRTFWDSYQIQSFHQYQQVKIGASTPTSERIGNDELNHLVNFKVQYDPADHHITITCGVINTERKAKEFILGLEERLKTRPKQGPPIKLRIVLHQLNSFYTGEGKLIHVQNHFARYIETYFRLKMTDPEYCTEHHIAASDEPIVAHINSALNGAARSGYIEDSYSHALNLEGLAAQSIWLLNDFKDISIFQNQRIQDNLTLLIRLRNELAQEKENIHSNNLKFSPVEVRLLDELNMCLFETAKICKMLNESYSDLSEEDEFVVVANENPTEAERLRQQYKSSVRKGDRLYIKSRLTVLSQILGSQILGDKTRLKVNRPFAYTALNLQGLERLQEIEMHLLNDIALGVVTEINCKSGLDRTGLIRSMWDAMRQMYNLFYSESLVSAPNDPSLAKALSYEALLAMLCNHESAIADVNEMISEIIVENKIVCMTDLFHLVDNPKVSTVRNLKGLLIAKIRSKYKIAEGSENESPKYRELMNAFNYQNLVAANLIKVAKLVTMESTGVPGMKWGKNYGTLDLGANPFPPKRMPRYIIISGMQKVIQLVDERNNLTPAGVQFLIRWGNLRGE